MRRSLMQIKLLSLLIFVALLGGLMVVPAQAASITATVNDVVASAGQTVTFTVTLSSEVTVKSGSVQISYDETVLSLVGGEWNVSNTMLSNFDVAKKVGAFAYSNGTAISGTVFSATFEVKDGAALGTFPVAMTVALKDGSNVSVSIVNESGEITVVSPLPDLVSSVNSVSAKRGDSVTFTATLSAGVTVKSGSVQILYDETVLSLVGGAWNVSNTMLSNFDVAKKVGAFAYSNGTAISGTIFSATFEVKDGAALGTFPVTMTVALKDGSNESISLVNESGQVTVISASSGLESSVNSVSASRGQTVTFTATLSAGITVKSGSVQLFYDSSVLSLVSGSWNLDNTMLQNFDVSKKVGAFAYQSGTPIGGTVVTVTFQVLDTAPAGVTDVGLKLTFKDGSGSNVEITNRNGTMEVIDEGGLSATVNDVSARVGETVAFTAILSEAVTVKSGAVTLTYDTSVLKLVSGVWNVSNAMLSNFDPANNVGVFAYQGVAEISGTVFTATFQVLEGAVVGTTEVGLAMQLRDGTSTAIAIQNKVGRMTVKPNEIISASIVWSSMSFTYTDGAWNPSEHEYEEGPWVADGENGGEITVTNEGNVAITAVFTYIPTVTPMTGTFTKDQITLQVEESETVSLTLAGKPEEPMSDAKIGSVTVTIFKVNQN